MKRFLFTALFLVFGSVQIASAASLVVAPATVSVTKGQTFSVSLSANPAGVKSYTVKAELLFPSALLEVVSFTPATGWLALSQPGYDLVDNVAGKLIKTGGYTGGFTEIKTFGTVIFKAKAAGNATIGVASTSLVLDAQSKNSLTGIQGSSAVTVSDIVVVPVPATPAPTKKAAPTPAKKTIPAPVSKTPIKEAVSVMATTTATSTLEVISATSTATTTPEISDEVAAVSGGFSGSAQMIFVVIVIAALVGWFLIRRF